MCVCNVWIACFDQSASIQGLPVGTVEGSTSTRSCRLEADKADFQAQFFPSVLALLAWAPVLSIDWESMASIFWMFYVEIQGVFLFVFPNGRGEVCVCVEHWHLVNKVQGGYISCQHRTPTIKCLSLSHTAFQCPHRHSCRWKAWLWLSEPNSILYLKTHVFACF